MNVVTSCQSVHSALRGTLNSIAIFVNPPSLTSFLQLKLLFILGEAVWFSGFMYCLFATPL